MDLSTMTDICHLTGYVMRSAIGSRHKSPAGRGLSSRWLRLAEATTIARWCSWRVGRSELQARRLGEGLWFIPQTMQPAYCVRLTPADLYRRSRRAA
jgi:hypothetical protein